MARLLPLIRALALAQLRQLRSLESALSNNFVVFALLLLGLQPKGSPFLPALVAVLLFIPLCAGPLRALPKERFQLLPLSFGDVLALRSAALLLAPPVWIAGALLLLGGPGARATAELVLIAALFLNLAFALGERLLLKLPAADPFRWIPDFPGSLGGLVRKDLRELLLRLDAWLALTLAVIGSLLRWGPARLPAEAGFGCALLVVLALSTCSQDLFADEGRAGLERRRLLPIRGWRLLLAKDLAFLGLILLLTLPLAPLAALGAGMAALVVGHHASVTREAPQAKWRFASSTSNGLGVLQVLALFIAGFLCQRASALWLLPLAGALTASLAYSGRGLEG